MNDRFDESTIYSNFVIDGKIRHSKYVDGLVLNREQIFKCPVCEKIQSDIEHGTIRKCGCGMIYRRYGNLLEMGRV